MAAGAGRGALVVRDQGGGPKFYVKWRHEGRQLERPIGPAWVVRVGEPGGRPNGRTVGRTWRERAGRNVPDGTYTVHAAREAVPGVIEAAERMLAEPDVSGGAVTVREAADAWLAWGERYDAGTGREAWKGSTRKNNRDLARRVCREFGDARMSNLRTADLESFLRDLRPEVGGRGSKRALDRPVSRRTRSAYVLVLRGIFGHAAREGWIAVSPAAPIPIGRSKRRKEQELRRDEYLTPEEVRAVAAEARQGWRHAGRGARSFGRLVEMRRRSDQDAAMVLTMALSGLRLGECLALRWRHLDLAGAVIAVEESRTRGLPEGEGERTRLVIGTPKSGVGRTVPLAPELAAALLALRTRGHSTGPDDNVFVGRAGGGVDAGKFRERFYAAQERVGMTTRKVHGLRHSFAVASAKHGVPLARIQAWLGHEDAATTMIYARFGSEATDAALVSAAFAIGGAATE